MMISSRRLRLASRKLPEAEQGIDRDGSKRFRSIDPVKGAKRRP
jgi:hypothetical protein